MTCESHDAIKRDPLKWRSLKFEGFQRWPDEPVLELRTCRCGSTLAVEVADKEAA